MKGLDYRWIQALDAVIAYGSFEKAAGALFVTQSAVSQRVKQLEKFVARPVLVRSIPPQPTAIGKKLLGLHRRVQLLETELLPEFDNSPRQTMLPVSIATNADSLATWLLPALAPLMQTRQVELDLLVEDETRSLNRLRSGEAIAAISTEVTPIQGCQSEYLGTMEYLCVGRPDFCERYFPEGLTAESAKHAPAVVFDRHDDMHTDYLSHYFRLPPASWPSHLVRSSEAFVSLALEGAAYCLIPKLMVKQHIERGELVNLHPGGGTTRTLYWHHFAMESGTLAEMTEACVTYARKFLAQ